MASRGAVDLHLVSGDFVVAQAPRLAASVQTANVIQERANLAEGRVGSRDDLSSLVGCS